MKNDTQELIRALVDKYPEYAEEAYEFMQSALVWATDRVCAGQAEKNLSAEELYMGACSYAIEEYGPLACEVLKFWGIESSEDVGRVVYNLIEAGIFGKQKNDSLEQFNNLADLRLLLRSPYMDEKSLDYAQPRAPRAKRKKRNDSKRQ